MTKQLIYLATFIFIGTSFIACNTEISEEAGSATIITDPAAGLRSMRAAEESTTKKVNAEYKEAFNAFAKGFGTIETTISYQDAKQFIMNNLSTVRNFTEGVFDRPVETVEYGEDVPYMYWYGQKVATTDKYSLMTYHWEADLGRTKYTMEFLASFSTDGLLIDRIPLNGNYKAEKGGFIRKAECAGEYNQDNQTIAVNWVSTIENETSSTEYNNKVYSIHDNGEFVIVADEINNTKE